MKVLVFAPHNDDEILGVGGTIAKYIADGNEVYVCEVTAGSKEHWEEIYAEAKLAHEVLHLTGYEALHLPVIDLNTARKRDVNAKFEEVVQKIKPNIVFIPHIGDMHSDHQETVKAAMVALRPYSNPQLREIYSYETLSETEWNLPSVDNAFIPDTWNDISEFIEIKKQAMKCYKSQLKEFPNPRSIEAIESLAKFRGSTIGFHYAEAFMNIRRKL